MNKYHRAPMPLRVKAVTLAVASCFAVTVPTALANPNGFAVVNGQVTFNYNGNTLTVTNTPGSIINWQRFSIGSSELTRFIQQSAASSVLNRVIGVDPSLILGALQSNGRVFLINPNGILFGAGAQLDVGGLVASTLNLSNQDFLAGRLKFTDTPGAGSVVNRGAITTPTGGQVYLIAPNVENSGIITSPQGEVILAAGRSVELVDAGTPGLRVELTAPDTEAVNIGQIIANSGKIGIYAGLIRNSGVIRADGVVVGEHGEILLKATGNTNLEAGSVVAASGAQGGNVTIQSGDATLVAGTVAAQGLGSPPQGQGEGGVGKGGTVKLLGNRVGVIDGALVDASGQAGGGTVLVGGDYQGRNPDVQNAWRTYVGPSASIRADAIASGDGGKVIVWSDDATRVYGSISARGGAQSGSGGFVETSGHSLDVTRGPDVSAPRGTPGTWLIDPDDLKVVPGGAIVNNTAAPRFDPLAESSSVGVALINAQLDFGSNVVLTTTSQGPAAGTQAGNITVSAPIVKKAATTTGPGGVFIGTTSLTMQAHNNIVIDSGGSITSTGDPLNVTLVADLDGKGGGGVTLGGGIFTNGGFVSIQGQDLTAINAPINTMRSLGSAGSVSLSSFANAVNVAAAITNGSFFSADGFTGVSINAPVTAGSSSMFLSSSTGPVSVAAPVSGGFFIANAGGASTLTLAAPVTSTGAALTADNFVITAALNAGSGGITVQQTTSGAPVDLGAGAQAKLDNLITTGPLALGNSSTGAIVVKTPLTAGSSASSVSVSSSASFTVNPGASFTTPVSLTVNAPAITVGGPVIANKVTFTTDTIAVNAPVTSATDIDISTRSFFRPVNLGVAVDGATSLDFTTTELSNLVNGSSNALRISTSGALTIQGPILRTGTQALALTGNSSIGQAPGATLNVTNLKLISSFGSINLPEANSVGTLAGSSGFGSLFKFANAAGTLLTIGSVDGTSGLTSSGGTINLVTDSLNVANNISASAVVIQPVSATTTKLDLGTTADAAGTLGISAAELARISATTLTLKADRADISLPVTASAGTLVIAPLTTTRALNIVSGAKSATSLDFTATELGNVTATSFVLGDATTGPVNVNAATTIPASVGTFTLRSGNPSGITVGTGFPIAAGRLSLIADAVAINDTVSATGGDLTVVPNTSGTTIGLGTGAGTLSLNTTEAGLLRATGTLFIGNSSAGNMTISSASGPAATFSGINALNLTSGGTITVSGGLTAPGNIFLTANDMAISAAVTASGASSNINVAPVGFGGTVTLGGAGGGLNLSNAELGFFAPGSGVLRIGDISNTGNIQITGAISPAPATTLSLRTGGGSGSTVTQTSGSTITITNLAVDSANAIALDENNSIGTVALSSRFGAVNFTKSGTPVNIGVVDGVSGIRAGFGGSPVTVRANGMNITSAISGSNVTLKPLIAGTLIDLGGPDAVSTVSTLGLTATELNLISATSVTIGDATSGNLVVSAPISISSFSDLTLTTGGTGGINTAATLTNTSRNITMVADSMTFGAGVSALSGTISLQQINPLTKIDLGGPDVVSTTNTLGLDSTDVSKLSASAFSIGNSSTPSITVSAATNFGTTPTTLTTASGATATIDVNAALASGALTLTSDNFRISPSGSVTAPNVTLNTITSGRTVDLGTSLFGATLGLDQPTLNRITTPGTFTINNAGLINVSAPVSFASAANLTLHGDTMTIGSTVTSSVGGRITVAPRTSFRPMDLGTNPVAGALGLTSLEITRFVTSGVLQFGDHTTSTGSINISNSIAPAPGVSALVLASNGSITQSAGKIISAPNLRVDAFGTVNLTENNSVATLAGLSFGNFIFTDAGSLNIGTVDGAIGISDSTVTIKADTLTVSQPISGFNVTLAPRVAGAAIDLGSKPAGVFGVTTAEMDLISAFNLTFGNSAAGPVTVSSAMTRSSGLLNIITGATQTVNINAALSGPSGVSVIGGTINAAAPVSSSSGSVSLNALAPTTLNVTAPVSAQFGVTMTSDVINLAAAITSKFGSVTLQPQTAGRAIDVGTENAAALSLTAAEIGLVTAPSLVIGNTSAGPLNVSAPIALAEDLTLRSGGTITQNPAATIVTRRLAGTPPSAQGSLTVVANGKVDLREANDVGVFLIGNAFGTASDFDFNNVNPLKLQNISVFASGKIRINAGVFAFVALAESPPFDICTLAPEICSPRNLADNDRFDPDKAKDKNKDADKNKNICGAT